MGEEPPRYFAYMLRLWQANAGGNLSWRATLESPHTGERLGFPDLKSLFSFLEDKTGNPEPREAGARSRIVAAEPARPAQLHSMPVDADPNQQRLVDAVTADPATDGIAPRRPEEE